MIDGRIQRELMSDAAVKSIVGLPYVTPKRRIYSKLDFVPLR